MKPFNVLFLLLAFLFLQPESLSAQDGITGGNLPPHQGEKWEEAQEFFQMIEGSYKKRYFDQGVSRREMGGTGYYPFQRAKYEYESRAFHDGTLPEHWLMYEESKKNTLKTQGPMAAANWQSMGPNTIDSLGGRMTCHAFHPQDPDIIYSGSSGGGLWKTTNGGDNWEVVSDNLPSLRISTIDINPLDPDHLIMGTGLYVGVSFTLQPGIGLLESKDGGNTWNPSGFSYGFASAVSVNRVIWDGSDPARIFLGANNGFWVSQDTGATWLNVLGGSISDIVQDPVSPNILYAGVHSVGVFKSTDSGQSWMQLGGGLPPTSAVHRINLSISETYPDHLLASVIGQNTWGLLGLYKSNDGGNTWNLLPNTPAYVCQPGGGSCIGWYVNQVKLHPVDTNMIYGAGVQYHRSSDGGQTWVWRDYLSNPCCGNNEGLCYVDTWDMGFHPNDPNTMYIFNDGGVQKSSDAGLWWEKKNEGLNTGMLYKIASAQTDSTRMIGGFQDHGLQSLNNANGNTFWTRWWLNDGCAVNIDPNQPFFTYGDVLFGVKYKHSNFGSDLNGSYTIMNGYNDVVSTAFLFSTIHDPVNSNILYSSSDNYIYKTTNGGLFWQQMQAVANVRQIGVSSVDPDWVYAATYNNSTWGFWYSSDGGVNWGQTVNSPGWRVTDIEADPVDLGVVYATRNSAFAGNPHVYRSTNHGTTWQAINTGLPDIPTWAITIHPLDNKCLYLATDLGVYLSTDAGQSWQTYNDNLPPYYVMDIHYQPTDTTIRIGTLGRGVWKTKSIPEQIVGVVTSGENHSSFQLEHAWPTPFEDEINIRFNLEAASSADLSLFNLKGQRVATKELDMIGKGKHTVKWELDAPTLSSGVYFLRLKAGGYAESIKVLRE